MLTYKNFIVLFNSGAIALSLGLTALSAHAQSRALDEKVWLRLGAFNPDIDSRIRLDRAGSSTPTGTDLVGERDLGLPRSKSVPSALIGLRLAGRWRAEFEYFSLRRSGQAPLGLSVAFGDSVFSAAVNSKLDSTVYRLSAGYSLLRTPNAEFGAVVGVHVTDFNVSLRGSALVNGIVLASAVEERSRTLPLPTLGLYGAYGFAPNWLASSRLDVFQLNRGGYSGKLANFEANVEYQFAGNFGVGAGWRTNTLRLDVDRGNFMGRVSYRFSGPQVFAKIGF